MNDIFHQRLIQRVREYYDLPTWLATDEEIEALHDSLGYAICRLDLAMHDLKMIMLDYIKGYGDCSK